MSYTSVNKLEAGTSKGDVIDFILLLGYRKKVFSLKMSRLLKEAQDHLDLPNIIEFYWFDEEDYRSWSGITLSVYQQDGSVCVETSSAIGSSYFDFEYQNKTIRLLRKHFGGTFETVEGKNRYLHPSRGASVPPASGCHLAFQRFGSNLITANQYFRSRNFRGPWKKGEVVVPSFLVPLNPWIVSNNLLLPFLVSIFEDYWKSTYISLLSYSDKKESVLRAGRFSVEHLVAISDNQMSIVEAFAETLPFQKISMICKHFKAIDSKLDFAGVLRKPYRRRKMNLFDCLEEMTEWRHEVVHRAEINPRLTEKYVVGLLDNLEVAITRCYRHLTKTYGWHYEQNWFIGKALPDEA